jgi:hypothetical protein
MAGYMNSPSGYLNPVAVDKVQHPDYDAKAAENTVMRTIQYLYPVIHNCAQMLEELCKHTEVQIPTDLQDNLDILKNISTMQIDWHPRTMLGEEAADELNSRMALHEEWAKQDGNEHHSITNWNNPYTDGQLAQAPPQTQMPPMYAQQPMQQSGASMYKPWTWFGAGGASTQPQPWQLPPPQLDQLHNGESYYTANGGGPPPLAQQQGYTTLPVGAIGWNMAGQPIDYNGMVVATTGEKLVGAALTKFL